MSRYYAGWAPYVPVAEKRRRAARAIAKLAGKGQTISPVKITGTKIASTFWGKAWCDNLERYRDFENRLPRGRTYVRNGSVLDLQIGPCEVRAMVSGSSLYHVSISIGVLPKAHWQSICRDCAGGIDSVVELLRGRLSKSVMERVCQPGKGLFPQPSEIKFTCSCPDYAFMCKHIAAVLYGVGARLDEQPELLFQLRAVDQKELITKVDSGLLLSKTGPDAAKVLVEDDISALFGLEMADDTVSPNASAESKPIRSEPVKNKRAKPPTRAVPPGRAVLNGAGAAPPKVRATAKLAAPIPRGSIKETTARRGVAGQLASTANKPVKVAAPNRANAAMLITRPTAKTSANTTTSAKPGRTTASFRSHRS